MQIERLCERLNSSLLIEDRRESLKEIKTLSKKYKLETGTQAMPVLVELCCLALDTLYNVVTCGDGESTDGGTAAPSSSSSAPSSTSLPADISIQFTEMLCKEQRNVELFFDLLDDFEFNTRWSTLKLLNSLIDNQSERMQELVLQLPRGLSRLIDLLIDSREIIRNEAILTLSKLAKSNANIQKIVAFESGFDRLFEIIDGEGSSALDGGVVVQDCFHLILTLLQTNVSNQSFFKEANYIRYLCKYFDLTSATENFSAQKRTNLAMLLKLIRCLVAPTNQAQLIADCQRAYNQLGLLHRLSAMVLLPGLPAELLSEVNNSYVPIVDLQSSYKALLYIYLHLA